MVAGVSLQDNGSRLCALGHTAWRIPAALQIRSCASSLHARNGQLCLPEQGVRTESHLRSATCFGLQDQSSATHAARPAANLLPLTRCPLPSYWPEAISSIGAWAAMQLCNHATMQLVRKHLASPRRAYGPPRRCDVGAWSSISIPAPEGIRMRSSAPPMISLKRLRLATNCTCASTSNAGMCCTSSSRASGWPAPSVACYFVVWASVMVCVGVSSNTGRHTSSRRAEARRVVNAILPRTGIIRNDRFLGKRFRARRKSIPFAWSVRSGP